MAEPNNNIKHNKQTMISTALFRMVFEYKAFDNYLEGLYQLLRVVKRTENIFVRIYVDHTIEDHIINALRSKDKVELVYFDNLTSVGLLGALLRYCPLFEEIPDVDYVMVLDLDLSYEIYYEYLSYLPQLKKASFAYSYRKWYRSQRYWYDNLSKGESHIIRGWGMGFVPGLLCGSKLLNDFILECRQTYVSTKNPLIKEFKKLNIEAIDIKSFTPAKNFSWAVSDRLQYGVVELFTTFYLMPHVIKLGCKIAQVTVQFGILHCLILDLLQNVPLQKKNEWFLSEFAMSFETFIKTMKEKNQFRGDHANVQVLWVEFIKFVSFLVKHNDLSVDEGLWEFIQNNSLIVTEKNNIRIYSDIVGGKEA